MKKEMFVFLIFLTFLFWHVPVIAQEPPLSEKELETGAIENFIAKQYEKALGYIDQLLDLYPKDPKFNYYSGACLVEIGRNYNTAIYQLKMASLGDVPDDVSFYIGRAYYHTGNSAQAAKYYNRFENNSSRELQRRLEFVKWKDFNSSDTGSPVELKPKNKVAGGGKPGYDQYISDALILQDRADSARLAAGKLRAQRSSNNPGEDPSALNRKIQQLDDQANEWQLEANDSYLQAREIEKTGSLSGFKLPGDKVSYRPGDPVPGRSGNPYIEQVSDAFYKQKEIRKILRISDITRLTELDDLNKPGNRMMKDAFQMEREKARQEVVASAAGSSSETNKALAKIEKLEYKISEKKLKAFRDYKFVNDGKYAVYDGTLEKILVNQDIDNYRVIHGYYQDAQTSYNRALKAREIAESTTNPEKQLDKFGESNAYELVALYNQKQALGTFAGIVNTRAATLPSEPVAQQPVAVRESPPVEPPQSKTAVPLPVQEQTETGISKNNTEVRKKEDQPIAAKIKEEPAPPAKKPPPEMAISEEKDPPPEHFNEFAILPTPDYNKMLPIPFDEELPHGVIYKIQLAAFRSTKPQSFFKGIEPITAEHIQYAIRYYAGKFSFYNDTKEALKKVKKKGFRDAFIVAYVNGYRSSPDKARNLENKLMSTVAGQTQALNTLMPEFPSGNGIVFKLQIGVFSKKLSPDMLRTYENYAGTKKIIFTTNNKGLFIYTIGNFSNFEDAGAFNVELKGYGFKDAFVVAYKNGQRIPLSEAR